MSFVEKIEKIQNEALEHFKNKNENYGNSFLEKGLVNIFVQLGDKINNLKNVTKNKERDLAIRNTLIDLHNCSAMAIMIFDDSVDYDEQDENSNENNNENEGEFIVEPEIENETLESNDSLDAAIKEESKYFVAEAGVGQIEHKDN